MPEWLTTDNVAIGVLVAGYAPVFYALRVLFADNKELRSLQRDDFKMALESEHARKDERREIIELLKANESANSNILKTLEEVGNAARKERVTIYQQIKKLAAAVAGLRGNGGG